MRSHLRRFALLVAGVLLALGSASSSLFAAIPTTPELDGSSLSAGLGLLAAGVLIVRSRRRR